MHDNAMFPLAEFVGNILVVLCHDYATPAFLGSLCWQNRDRNDPICVTSPKEAKVEMMVHNYRPFGQCI